MPPKLNPSAAATVKINGKPVRLLLTLDALGELEDELGVVGLAEVSARITSPSVQDLITIVAVLSKAAGNPVTKADIGRASGASIAGLIVGVTAAIKGEPASPTADPDTDKASTPKRPARRRSK